MSTDIEDRFRLLQMRHAPVAPPVPTESSETPRISPETPGRVADGQSDQERWDGFERGAYSRLGLDGLARMAWARFRAGEIVDKLDRYVMERVTEEECRW